MIAYQDRNYKWPQPETALDELSHPFYSIPTLVFPGTMYAYRGKHAENPSQALSFEC